MTEKEFFKFINSKENIEERERGARQPWGWLTKAPTKTDTAKSREKVVNIKEQASELRKIKQENVYLQNGGLKKEMMKKNKLVNERRTKRKIMRRSKQINNI